jgi:predicted alpha/beta superfamily hydrolase
MKILFFWVCGIAFLASCTEEPIVNSETTFVLSNPRTDTDHVIDVIELGTEGEPEMFFVLDGESMLDLSINAYNASGVTQKIKIISLRYADSNKRSRDFTMTENGEGTGEADSFLEFIRTDLDSALLNRMVYDSGATKILAGHSLGGLFTSYTLIQDTFFFDKFVVLSPSLFWNDFVFFQLEEENRINTFRTVSAYLGAGKGEDFGINNGLDKWQEVLESNYPNVVNRKKRVDGSHMSSIEENLVNAFQFLLP